MLNVVVLIGRLVRDPELRHTGSGIPVGNFTLAVERPFPNQQGEREADFIDVVVWRRQAENVAQHLAQGLRVAVRGRLQIRSYEDRQGVRRKVAEVVADDVRFIDWASDRQRGGDPSASPDPFSGGGDFSDSPFGGDAFSGDAFDPASDDDNLADDDVPF